MQHARNGRFEVSLLPLGRKKHETGYSVNRWFDSCAHPHDDGVVQAVIRLISANKLSTPCANGSRASACCAAQTSQSSRLRPSIVSSVAAGSSRGRASNARARSTWAARSASRRNGASDCRPACAVGALPIACALPPRAALLLRPSGGSVRPATARIRGR